MDNTEEKKVLANIHISIYEGTKVDLTSNLPHNDMVMFYLIESIYALRNKQYEEFLKYNKDVNL